MKKYILPLFALSTLLFVAFDNDELEASKARGEEVYMSYCINCHMASGEGIPGVFPPLAKADYMMADIDRAIQVVKYGQMGEITVNGTVYNNAMPSPGLDDDEIADVLNYVLNSWGNKYEGEMIRTEQVARIQQP